VKRTILHEPKLRQRPGLLTGPRRQLPLRSGWR
jgi:hypothetical protein